MTQALTIRPATRADLPAILALYEDDDHSRGREDMREPLAPAYLAAWKAIAADPNQLLVLATLDGAPAGTLQLTFTPGLAYRGAWRCTIEMVRIASTLRNQGRGAELIGWAVEQARGRGCAFVQLTSHVEREPAHRFYRRLGFAQSHAGFKLAL